MQINPYLVFNGQCEAAFKFYEQLLGGKITGMMTHGGSPMANQTPPEWRDKIMHVHMTVGDWVLMGSDAPPQHFQKPQGFAVSLQVKTTQEAERIFRALSESGTVQMPLQKTFWSAGFGMATDRFGIPWMVNCEQAA
ncbi:MAG TPA: VOC family protein [Candidatus Methylomirabilis sp.]|nr:VOC family protein [Candidatus Methylomirabilis sp.]